MSTTSKTIAQAWRDRAPELAALVMKTMVNRTDRYGAYSADGGQITADGPLDEARLARHWAQPGRGTVVGLHTTAIVDEECLSKWGAIDIDRHGDEGDADANERFALAKLDQLADEFDLSGLLHTSNGAGGFHLRIGFAEAVPTPKLHAFLKWLVRDWADFGLGHEPEVFPKQADIRHTPKQLGNWLRLFGPHHKRDHWSCVWDDESREWLTGTPAVDRICQYLDLSINPARMLAPGLIPAEVFAAEARHRSPRAGTKRSQNQFASDDDAQHAAEALQYLPSDYVDDYDQWIRVGQALTGLGSEGLRLWTDWSRASTKYATGDCETKWGTFSDQGIQLGSLFAWAKANGWVPPWSKPAPVGFARHRATADAQARPVGGDGASATGPEPEPEPAEGLEPADRPTITITTEIDVVADQAVDLLAHDPNVYQRGRTLVHIVRDGTRRRFRAATRPAGAPAIVPMTAANVLDRLCRGARWCRLRPLKDGGYEAVPAVLPENVIKTVLERRHWADIRPLEGVVEAPTLRPDGTILDRPGWDPATGLLFEPSQTFPAIPDRPTRAQARAAAELLLDLAADFPFKEGHRAAWLAGLLTPLARFAIDGPTPLFLFDANVPGAGKSMLADIIALIATGRLMARSAYPEKDDEVRKLILSIALAGDRMLLFDNVATGFSVGGAALDGALTATSIKDRILGKSEMSGDVPWNTVLYCTGNNLGLRGDALRRVVPCRLESPEVSPEERTEFRHPDLLGYIREHRGDLVAAGLTILRGYVVGGRPKPEPKLPSMDFRAWAGLIRHAIYWAIGEDPCEGRKELKENDAETVALHGLVAGWAELCKVHEDGITTGAAMRILADPPANLAALRAIVVEWSTDGGLPSSYVVGRRLAKARGRMTPAGALTFSIDEGNKKWIVKPAIPPAQPKPLGEQASCGPVGGDGGDGGHGRNPRGQDLNSESVRERQRPSPPSPPSPPDATHPDWLLIARGPSPRPAALPTEADGGWEDVA